MEFGGGGRLYALSERVFDGMLGAYRRTLEIVLRHRVVTFGVFLVTVAGTGALFMIVPKGFIPNEDQGQIFINRGIPPYVVVRTPSRASRDRSSPAACSSVSRCSVPASWHDGPPRCSACPVSALCRRVGVTVSR